jgi:hypothetical protein
VSNKDTPDNITDLAHVLPYGSNVGAPAIKPDHNITGWKHAAVHAANKHYKDRYNELMEQLKALGDEFKCNDMMYNAEMRIKPVIGKVYHLYQREDGSRYVSLFSPEERIIDREGWLGSFRLNYDNRWIPA